MATLVRYNRFPSFFNNFRGPEEYEHPLRQDANLPAANVKETDSAFVLEVAAPGLKKENLKINVEKGVLSVGYQHETNTEETTDKYTRREFSYTSFERSFRLPKHVDADNIKASYTDGILSVEIPKVEPKADNEVKEISIS